MKRNALKEFDLVTDKLAEYFVKKYFGKDLIYDDDFYWVGSSDEDREVLSVGDYFFSLSDVVSFLRYKYTEDELFKYYDYSIDKYTKEEICINIKNWKELKYEKRKKKSKIQ